MVTVEEYRKILNDQVSSEDVIKRRIAYLEAYCRSVARVELEAYVKEIKEKTKKTSSND